MKTSRRAARISVFSCCLAVSMILSVATRASAQTPADETAPALAVQSLEFLPGQGREARNFLLYQFADESEPYLDLWDATQILQANRYFDPVTRKVALGLGAHRVKFTDGSSWIFVDTRPRLLNAPCRIVAGRMYLPLSVWPVLLEELPDLPLRRDANALRLIGGLRTVNVLDVEWIYAGERLRGVFRLAEPLDAWVERLGDRGLRIRFAGGRLADYDWEKLPRQSPLDSLRVGDEEDGARLDLFFRQVPREVRSAADPMARTWAFTAELPRKPGLVEPEFDRELADRLPDPMIGARSLSRIVLDPGHGGSDTGAVSGNQMEKDWNLRMAGWLEDHLEDEGFRVLWTRREDRDYTSPDRSQAANVAEADLFLSLHFTRRGAEGERGLEIIVQDCQSSLSGAHKLLPWRGVQAEHGESSLELAAGLQQALSVLTDWPQLGIRREETAVLEGLDMPALMLEFGNLDSAAERAAWEDRPTREERLETLAQALSYRARRWERESRR